MLPAEDSPPKKPRLPRCPNDPGRWHDQAKRWWKEVWESPMRVQYTWGDIPALVRLATLVDWYWKTGKLDVAKEIRLLEREFGLTPLSRRRLEWQIVQTEDAIETFREKQAKRPRVVNGGDPREVLNN